MKIIAQLTSIIQSGSVVLATALTAQIKLTGATLSQVSTEGTVTMTLHQVNADGAGQMTCSVSTDAAGKTFTAMTITTNVPGTNSRGNAANTNFPLVAKLPASTACTGTVGTDTNVCVVKCANPVGHFGSNVLGQQGAAKKERSVGTGRSMAARAKGMLRLLEPWQSGHRISSAYKTQFGRRLLVPVHESVCKFFQIGKERLSVKQ